MINKNYSLPAPLVVNEEEVWYSNQYRQSEWDGMWYVYKTHFYRYKGNALRWYRQRTIMSDYYAEFNTQKVTKL